MNLDDVYKVSDNLEVASPGDLKSAETSLGASFPDDYGEYVTRLGQGELCDFLRMLMPVEVIQRTRDFRELVESDLIWEGEQREAYIPRGRALNCVALAYTIDGDTLLFHPVQTERFYFWTRDAGIVDDVGQTLEEAIQWLGNAGNLHGHPGFYYFESWKNRSDILGSCPALVADVQAVKDELLSLGFHDHFLADETGDEPSYEFFVHDFFGRITCFATSEWGEPPGGMPGTMAVHWEGQDYRLPDTVAEGVREIVAAFHESPGQPPDWGRLLGGHASFAEMVESLEPLPRVPHTDIFIRLDTDRYTETLRQIVRRLGELGIHCGEPSPWT